jgi:hypothetical protein
MTQITDLVQSIAFGDGDLTLIRKSAALNDTSITYSNLLKSLGNPAISGFNAVSEAVNKLTLTAVNLAPIDTYFNGMRVSFISSISSNGAVQIKIGTLVYKDLFQYGTTETSILEADKYYEAIYIGDNNTGKFFQTNILTPTIYTNEYTSVGTVAQDEQSTTLVLTSAIGMAKTSYYTGMSLLFTNDVDSKGVVSVNVDGLGLKVLRDKLTDLISNDLFEGQTILATYDGTQFIKQKFGNIEETPDIVVPPPAVNPPAPPPDPWDPNYAGDPDDPAGAISPDSVDSQGRRFFETDVLTVGTNGRYDSITAAIQDLVKNFGDNGNGKRYAIVIKNNFDQTKLSNSVFGGNRENVDLSWISIFSENNLLVTFTGYNGNTSLFHLYSAVSPIINFKIKRTGNQGRGIFYSVNQTRMKLILGRNCEISQESTSQEPFIFWLKNASDTVNIIQAVFGLKIACAFPIFVQGGDQIIKLLINKGTFTHTGTTGYFMVLNYRQDVIIYNSTITFSSTSSSGGFNISGLVGSQSIIQMRNVTNTNRTGTQIGIISRESNTTLDNCNFRGSGANTPNGYDIMVNGVTKANTILLLNGTTGALNQAEGAETTNGAISRVV